MHNKVLSEYLKAKGNNKDLNDVILKKILKKNNLPYNKKYKEFTNIVLEFMEDKNGSFFNLIDKLHYNDKEKYLIKTSFSELKKFKKSDYDKIQKFVANFENDVLKKYKNQKEIKNFLGTVSTLRYSLFFWNNYSNNVQMKLKWWKWLVVVAVDAGGFCLGGGTTAGAAAVSAGVAASSLAHTMIKSPC